MLNLQKIATSSVRGSWKSVKVSRTYHNWTWPFVIQDRCCIREENGFGHGVVFIGTRRRRVTSIEPRENSKKHMKVKWMEIGRGEIPSMELTGGSCNASGKSLWSKILSESLWYFCIVLKRGFVKVAYVVQIDSGNVVHVINYTKQYEELKGTPLLSVLDRALFGYYSRHDYPNRYQSITGFIKK